MSTAAPGQPQEQSPRGAPTTTASGLGDRARSALTRFKVMAVIVGLGLLVLTLEVVLHYGFDDDTLAWWSPIHGVLYMLYLITVADLGMKVRWTPGKMIGVMLAGVVPFFSFIMERKVARELEGPAGPVRQGSSAA